MTTNINDVISLPLAKLVALCESWKADMILQGRWSEIQADIKAHPLKCPVHSWVVVNNAKCNRELVPNTILCPVCGNPCCPDCKNHQVEVISRVTGYMSTVSGWNEAKKQEFEDRNRYDLRGVTQ